MKDISDIEEQLALLGQEPEEDILIEEENDGTLEWEEEAGDYETDPNSVQVLYRPVLQGDVPDVPPDDPDHPDFIWWAEQIRRCLFGWVAPDGHYLCGYHYFYLNFAKIKFRDPKTKRWKVEIPLYRDEDDDVLSILWQLTPRKMPDGTDSQGGNFIKAKPRGIGWTMYSLLGVGMYTFVFRPENPVGCAYPDKDVMKKERILFERAWGELHPIFKRWNGVDLIATVNSEEQFAVGRKIEGSKLRSTHNFVQWNMIGSESAGVYKGDRMSVIIAVEAGKWKGNSLKNFFSENEPSISLGGDQWGMFIAGGTSNAIINKSTAYKEMFDTPESFNAIAHFTPGTRVLAGHVDYKTGKSKEEEALATILSRREAKRGDPDGYQQELIENPLTPEEAFTPNIQFSYSKALINEQINYIKLNHIDHYWRRGKLEWEKDVNNQNTDRVRFVEDGTGHWLYNMEAPPTNRYENLHVAGIDDRYKNYLPGQKRKKEDSKNAMVVWRQPTRHGIKCDMPVGVYLSDLPDMMDTYEEFYKGMVFWDIKQSLYEYNHEAFIIFLKAKKELNRLFYIDDKPGIKVTPKVKTELTSLGSQFFRDGRHRNITCIDILDALSVWGSGVNTDVGSAFHVLLHLLDVTKDFEITVKVEEGARSDGNYIMLGQSFEEKSYMADNGNFIQLGRRA